MDGPYYFSILVIIVIFATVVTIAIKMGEAPGKAAKARNHPYAAAVEVAGWATLVVSFLVPWSLVVWALSLTWAYAVPTDAESEDAEI